MFDTVESLQKHQGLYESNPTYRLGLTIVSP